MNLELFTSTYTATFLDIMILNTIALISPGPDFAVVVKHSLVHSKKAGMVTMLGIVAGEIVHLSYILLGVGVVIATNIWLLNTIKLLGVCYLSYLGVKMILAKKVLQSDNIINTKNATMTLFHAFQSGFLVNLLNPKAIMFFLGVFTVVVDLETPLSILVLYAIAIILSTVIWFSLVAQLFSAPRIRKQFMQVKHWIERLTGGLLILISIKLALTKEY